MNIINQGKAVSNWLTSCLIQDQWFDLSNQQFWYRVSSAGFCGSKKDVHHFMSLTKDEFVTIEHTHLWNLIAGLHTKLCSNVETKQNY